MEERKIEMGQRILSDVVFGMVVVLFLTRIIDVRGSSIYIEAEAMFGDGIIESRAKASNRKSLHLYSGDVIKYEMCIMSTTAVHMTEFMYSNDGDIDRVTVEIDNQLLGTVESVLRDENGRGWNVFHSPKTGFRDLVMYEGRHLLTVTVLEADKHGIEVDYLSLKLNTTQSLDSTLCQVFCFGDVAYEDKSKVVNITQGTAVQKSTKTRCAEEDNVNVPVYHSSAEAFIVSSLLPKYTSFLNSRGPDWTDCSTAQSFWNFTNVSPGQNNTLLYSSIAQLNLNFHHRYLVDATSNYLGSIDIVFSLNGPSTGHTDSEIGTIVFLKNIQFSGAIILRFEFLNRFNKWSFAQKRTVKTSSDELTFNTPDFSLKEGQGNMIRISMYSEQANVNSLSIGEIYMKNRYMQPDQNKKIYDDGITVIEAVNIDMWWRINETMTVTVSRTSGAKTFDDVNYIRVYRRIPWSNNDFAQIFVMYQDGNIRLLPITPHGLDWIPFGSSVILGQTDPSAVRPCAPISHLNIEPDGLKLTVYYTDGGVLSFNIMSTLTETSLVVSGCTYARDLSVFPFFTFRSMYVSDGNGDVDHIATDDSSSVRILDQWEKLYGHFFAFFRKCISKHNTLSPDITLTILK